MSNALGGGGMMVEIRDALGGGGPDGCLGGPGEEALLRIVNRSGCSVD
jgi:hypothetical protein